MRRRWASGVFGDEPGDPFTGRWAERGRQNAFHRPLLAAVGCVAVVCAVAVAIPWLQQDYPEDRAFLDRVAARAALAGRELPEPEARRRVPSRRAQTAAAERQRMQAAALLRESRASGRARPSRLGAVHRSRLRKRRTGSAKHPGGRLHDRHDAARRPLRDAPHRHGDGTAAAALAVKDVDARAALMTLADSWRVGIGRSLGYVDVFYGQAHLATVRATDSGPARITFH